MELPLQQLAPTLSAFAAAHGLELTSSGKWPDRSFRWGTPISRLIQIFVDAERGPTFKFWICAYEDREDGRYWRQETLASGLTIDVLARDLPALLESGYTRLMAWGASDLELAAAPRATFFSISVWFLLIYALGSTAAGYAATRLSGSIAIGIVAGLATFILLIVGSFAVIRFWRA